MRIENCKRKKVFQFSIPDSIARKTSKKGQTVDALALGGEEGRDKLR